MKRLLPSAALLISLPTSLGWGTLGHQTVAYVASNFVQPTTREFFQNIINDDTDSYLAIVATWADSFRYTAAGRFSAPFHFIDAEDDPPLICSVKYDRDCSAKGCIIGAINNYTTQLLDPSTNPWMRNMAAKFIIHFIGDIHQPLHDEALSIGGNAIKVLFKGVETNLHHVWDSNMAEEYIGGYGLPFASAWASNLSAAIKYGSYHKVTESWLAGIDVDDPVSTALAWAIEANQFVCTNVLKDGIEGIRGAELSGRYYEESIPVIELQVARAGYRLAVWLDLIAQGGKYELK